MMEPMSPPLLPTTSNHAGHLESERHAVSHARLAAGGEHVDDAFDDMPETALPAALEGSAYQKRVTGQVNTGRSPPSQIQIGKQTSLAPESISASEINTTQAVEETQDATPPPPATLIGSMLPQAHPSTMRVEPLKVFLVALVAFDHALGPIVEWRYPAVEGQAVDDEINNALPFLALPDGAHLQREDYALFHLFLPHLSDSSTVFGVSCNRQISASELLHPDPNVTRSIVQKAVVVLANKPIFGCLRDKLGVVTRALFAQRDFSDRQLLIDFYLSLKASFALGLGQGGGEIRATLEDDKLASKSSFSRKSHAGSQGQARNDESAMYMGYSLRDLIRRFRSKTLQLLKLMMLQRKIMFYGHTCTVEVLCTLQYALVSAMPCLLINLEDAGTPILNERIRHLRRPSSLKTSERSSLLRYLGLPLNIFGEDSFFQPYLPLQQIDLLQASSWICGTTNSLIIQQQRDIDVVVNIDTTSLDFRDPKLAAIVALTPADRKWMDELTTSVESTLNSSDPSRPVGNKFHGSDDYLRLEFEGYICSILASIKYVDFKLQHAGGAILMLSDDKSPNTAFGDAFVSALKNTRAFKQWNQLTDSAVFDLVDPIHPCGGQVSVVEDVGLRLKSLNLDTHLNTGREMAARSLATGLASSSRMFNTLRADLAKRQADWSSRSETQVSDAVSAPETHLQRASTLASSVSQFFRTPRSPTTATEMSEPRRETSLANVPPTQEPPVDTFFRYSTSHSS